MCQTRPELWIAISSTSDLVVMLALFCCTRYSVVLFGPPPQQQDVFLSHATTQLMKAVDQRRLVT